VLLGLPAGELAGADLHADEVLGAQVREVHDRVREAGDWPARFAVLDDWLLRRMTRHERAAAVPDLVAGAWLRLLSAGGRLRVDRLAAESAVSERHLRNRFRAEIGLAPKAAARVIRFDLARRRLAGRSGPPRRGPRDLAGGSGPQDPAGRSGPRDLAGLAADCGFADQSHLDREFAALAACSPSDWLAQEFRNIQSGHHPPEEGW
jgi:AraC-like DNA-binding protein